jgi:xanthine dehydrogenase YagS FAD-binding subunit
MRFYAYARATDLAASLRAGAEHRTAFLAGGTELLNWLRIGIEAPERVLDIARLEGLDRIEDLPGRGLRIGALAKLADVAKHEAVRRHYPVLSQAILQSASPQIRNLATIGGNPLQKTRCPYFRASEPTPCNRRLAGSGCAALHGLNDNHAIFGWTEACVATQPADPPVALAALDAVYVTEHQSGGRRLLATDLHLLPGDSVDRDTVLMRGEIITAIELAAPAPRSAYVKVRERESYEYAIVSAAVALDLDGDTIHKARVALGSVAMKPWRLNLAEERLSGVRLADRDGLSRALDAAMAEARPLSHNAYKIPLARNAALRAIANAGRPA